MKKRSSEERNIGLLRADGAGLSVEELRRGEGFRMRAIIGGAAN
jgi:hypothetical protein